MSQTVEFQAGELIYRQGEAPEPLVAYVIISGAVEVSLEVPGAPSRVLAQLGEGDIVGELSLIDGHVRSANVVALTDCRMLLVGRRQILNRLEESDPFVVDMFRTMVRRLRLAYGDVGVDQGHSDFIGELSFERDMEEGLERGEFVPFLQPIVDMATGHTAGFEALARWRLSGGGLRPPADFIPLAEKTRLIQRIDMTVMTQAACALAASAHTGFLSSNLSASQFSDDRIIDRVASVLSVSGLHPSRLHLEVNESALISADARTRHILEELRGLGASISLDDFGTGYSSLGYLHTLPIDTLKIDQSFVRAMERGEKARRLIAGMVTMAGTLEMDVVVEGVETAEESALIRDMGATWAQGWLHGRPAPVEEALSRPAPAKPSGSTFVF
ncbi:EAL domain-containing protein [Radicibacter daui]|uniref:EAL domain-containing protein n=1 Tax=Radicibacter daui TaxID=3064829 RepID=UPI004046B50F